MKQTIARRLAALEAVYSDDGLETPQTAEAWARAAAAVNKAYGYGLEPAALDPAAAAAAFELAMSNTYGTHEGGL